MDKRYYWIKLKTDFFNQETMDFLLSQKNGCEYIVLYQMLCLNTANNNGKMCSKIGEKIIPYDVNKIVRDTKFFDFDTVTIALGLFKKLGLIYEEEEDKTLRIANYETMIGSEAGNANAQRQKRFREKQKQLLQEKKCVCESMDTKCIQDGYTGKDRLELVKDNIIIKEEKQLNSTVTNSNALSNAKNNEEIEYRDKILDIDNIIKEEINKEEKKDVYSIIENEFGRPLSPIEYETIKHWLDENDEEIIRKAIKEASLNSVYNLKYIGKILDNWKKNIRKNKDIIPEWFNNPKGKDEASDEKKKEMEDILKKFGG